MLCLLVEMTLWVRRLAWEQSQSFAAWLVSLHLQRIDDWIGEPAEKLDVRPVHDVLREQFGSALERGRERDCERINRLCGCRRLRGDKAAHETVVDC
jgi:hypothetical protein